MFMITRVQQHFAKKIKQYLTINTFDDSIMLVCFIAVWNNKLRLPFDKSCLCTHNFLLLLIILAETKCWRNAVFIQIQIDFNHLLNSQGGLRCCDDSNDFFAIQNWCCAQTSTIDHDKWNRTRKQQANNKEPWGVCQGGINQGHFS